jgi:hypothetical protein
MVMVRFNCRVCKLKVDGKVVAEFSELLPPGLKCVECSKCGVLGIELNPEIINSDMPSDLRLCE